MKVHWDKVRENYNLIREKGFREFWKGWKVDYMLSPQDQILKGQVRFYAIIIFGLWAAAFQLAFAKRWIYLIPILGTIGLLYYQVKPVLIQLMEYKEEEKKMEEKIREDIEEVCDATGGSIGEIPFVQEEDLRKMATGYKELLETMEDTKDLIKIASTPEELLEQMKDAKKGDMFVFDERLKEFKNERT